MTLGLTTTEGQPALVDDGLGVTAFVTSTAGPLSHLSWISLLSRGDSDGSRMLIIE